MKPRKEKAFTLIELLVVIAIIALLLAILMPALNVVKEQAAQIPCLANMKTLGQGFYMYQLENNGALLSAYTWARSWANGTRPNSLRAAFAYDAWVYGPLSYGASGAMNDEVATSNASIEYEQNGIREGKMWPYVKNIKSYHCPADKRASRSKIGFRSYSMVATIRNAHDGTTADDHQIHKMGEIKSPSDKFIIVESQHKEGTVHTWNKGAWVINLIDNNWAEAPANWHSKGVSLAYADGHVEKYKWRSKETLDWLGSEDIPNAPNPAHSNTEDFLYFSRHIPRADR
jgi:prepilin-type N-terminal cleavage/methylation domain-containing protein/prepilin-type processing-associated H-X9-DG protein